MMPKWMPNGSQNSLKTEKMWQKCMPKIISKFKAFSGALGACRPALHGDGKREKYFPLVMFWFEWCLSRGV